MIRKWTRGHNMHCPGMVFIQQPDSTYQGHPYPFCFSHGLNQDAPTHTPLDTDSLTLTSHGLPWIALTASWMPTGQLPLLAFHCASLSGLSLTQKCWRNGAHWSGLSFGLCLWKSIGPVNLYIVGVNDVCPHVQKHVLCLYAFVYFKIKACHYLTHHVPCLVSGHHFNHIHVYTCMYVHGCMWFVDPLSKWME